MAIYYIDPMDGRAENSGLSMAEPLDTNKNLTVRAGDTVLFKRGSKIRDELGNVSGEEGRPITYGAYGEGDDPMFLGSVDVSGEDCWRQEPDRPDLWRCTVPLATQVGNFIFDGREGGALQWERKDLTQNGDWWDNGFGDEHAPLPAPEDRAVLLCCEDNPGRFYRHIECAQCVHRSLASGGHDMVIENLTFYGNAIHGLSRGDPSYNLTVRNCRFEFIGGCVWSHRLRIRFGNGVEFWDSAENITVEGCTFREIYDSGVTHQGEHDVCRPAVNLVFRNNLFINCGMAAYEQRDVLPLSAEFTGNVCADAGRGFSHRHTLMPRQSEIWPQPMGHHIFIWRIDGPTEGADFKICGNVFLDAPFGAAVYSIIDRAAEAQITLDGNVYQVRERALLNRFGGDSFNSLRDFTRATGKEKHGTQV